jgi:hypothetical protein
MSHKIQISVTIFAVLAAAIWAFSNNSNPLPPKTTSSSSTPTPEIISNPVVSQNQHYSDDLKKYLDNMVTNGDAVINETLKETVSTYVNSEGQQIEIIVTSGSKDADIVPAR